MGSNEGQYSNGRGKRERGVKVWKVEVWKGGERNAETGSTLGPLRLRQDQTQTQGRILTGLAFIVDLLVSVPLVRVIVIKEAHDGDLDSMCLAWENVFVSCLY